jgi:hypothetical protein
VKRKVEQKRLAWIKAEWIDDPFIKKARVPFKTPKDFKPDDKEWLNKIRKYADDFAKEVPKAAPEPLLGVWEEGHNVTGGDGSKSYFSYIYEFKAGGVGEYRFESDYLSEKKESISWKREDGKFYYKHASSSKWIGPATFKEEYWKKKS